MNGDGLDDIIVPRPSRSAGLYLGRPNRTFNGPIELGGSSAFPVVADVDNDGAPEILLHDPGSGILRVVAVRGHSSPMVIGETHVPGDRILVGHLDEDDWIDLLVLASPPLEARTFYAGDGTGGFTYCAALLPDPRVRDVRLADMNLDGLVEAIAIDRSKEMVQIFRDVSGAGFTSSTKPHTRP